MILSWVTRVLGDDSESWGLEKLRPKHFQSADGVFTYMLGSWAGMMEGQVQRGLSPRAFSMTVPGQMYNRVVQGSKNHSVPRGQGGSCKAFYDNFRNYTITSLCFIDQASLRAHPGSKGESIHPTS